MPYTHLPLRYLIYPPYRRYSRAPCAQPHQNARLGCWKSYDLGWFFGPSTPKKIPKMLVKAREGQGGVLWGCCTSHTQGGGHLVAYSHVKSDEKAQMAQGLTKSVVEWAFGDFLVVSELTKSIGELPETRVDQIHREKQLPETSLLTCFLVGSTPKNFQQ